MTISLRPFVAADAAWLDEWLASVAQSVGCNGIGDAPGATITARLQREKNLRAHIIERDGEPAGVTLFRLKAPTKSSAIVELVATPPSESRRGAGMAAATLIEPELRAAGVRTVYAPAPEIHGIAMYFWIRLGYHPLLRPDWPCEREGVAWLTRTL